jgi:hypothetical protein
MRAHRAFAITVLVLAAAMLTACGPRYQTFTNYTPPASDFGRQCVAQCLNARQLCRQHASAEVQQCRSEAQQLATVETLKRQAEYQIDLERFRAGLIRDEPPRPATVTPATGRCDQQGSRIERQCSGDFDLCYQNCGGTVTYTTRCGANCD